MKNRYSFISCILIGIVLVLFRIGYTEKSQQLPIKVTTWDALGYYMYLPASFIYHDEKDLHWFPKIDSTYSLSGGNLYQANRQENGAFVFKYLEGVSIIQLPAFFMAHWYAKFSDYPADGFSAPYQFAIAWWCILCCIASIFLLRKILLRYYSDHIVSITLLLLLLASNFIQYVSIDSAQSHGYIFPMYVLIIYFTIKWHETKKISWSVLIGLTIGIATISRPTEAIMLFIPLLWNVESTKDLKNTISYLFTHKVHLLVIGISILVAISPQLFYWKRITGSWVYDVGSKWDFLKPHFQVLVGFEKGWFVYTPVTILFVLGFFFMKGKPFQRAVLTFCLLNIHIIIAWHVWRYGGSYSCRALVQSYPVFAFALAGIISYLSNLRYKWILACIACYLFIVNFIQIIQYNRTIIHYDDMNFNYYKAIYLKLNPTPLDMSLLDTKDFLSNSSNYSEHLLLKQTDSIQLQNQSMLLKLDTLTQAKSEWIKVDISLSNCSNLWGSYLVNKYPDHDTIAIKKIRLFNAISKEGSLNHYSYFLHFSAPNSLSNLTISIEGNDGFHGTLQQLILSDFKTK